jgi:hypothetical protein
MNSSMIVELDIGILSYESSQLPVVIDMATLTTEIRAAKGITYDRTGTAFLALFECFAIIIDLNIKP